MFESPSTNWSGRWVGTLPPTQHWSCFPSSRRHVDAEVVGHLHPEDAAAAPDAAHLPDLLRLRRVHQRVAPEQHGVHAYPTHTHTSLTHTHTAHTCVPLTHMRTSLALRQIKTRCTRSTSLTHAYLTHTRTSETRTTRCARIPYTRTPHLHRHT